MASVFTSKTVLQFLYWFCLGVCSSIGIGFGFPTGALFLAPHVLENQVPKSILQTFRVVYPACLSWGLGTAVGEIPPFLLGRRLGHVPRVEVSDRWPKVIKWLAEALEVVLVRSTEWALRRTGFLGIVFLSAWPNLAFDLVGIVAGVQGMTFSRFFAGLVLGKAVLKTLLETYFVVVGFDALADKIPGRWHVGLLWNMITIGWFLLFARSLWNQWWVNPAPQPGGDTHTVKKKIC